MTSSYGKSFIKSLEGGFRPDLHYVNGVPHWGYGFNAYYHPYPCNAWDATCSQVTREFADDYFEQILPYYEQDVVELAPYINQNQADSLVSFAYQRGHIPNELAALVKSGQHDKAADWIETNYFNAPPSRRKAEADLYRSPIPRVKSSWLLTAVAGVLVAYLYFKHRKK